MADTQLITDGQPRESGSSSVNTRPLTGVMVKLESSDNRLFEVPIEAAELSSLIRMALNRGDDDDEDDEDDDHADERNGLGPQNSIVQYDAVRLLRVTGRALEHIVKFMIHYLEEPMTEIKSPLGADSFELVVTQKWYQDFLKEDVISREMLFEILSASNYLGLEQLLDLATLKITFLITGRTADEIRVILRLPELTPEEEARARQEHSWIFDDSSSA